MAFRVLDQARTFYGLSGQLLAGGYVTFMGAGGTTPKDVYGERGLTTNNGSTIALDATGRLEHDVWASGDVRYRVYDADDVEQADVDWNIDPSAAGLSLPSGDAGQFLTTDGTTPSFVDISQVPDQTGQANKYLKTDGTAASWAALVVPAVPTDGVEDTPTGFRIGTVELVSGTGSFAASGTQASTASITFGVTFNSAPKIWIQMDGASMYLHPRVDSKTTTGASLSCDSNIIGELINVSQSFTWFALGDVTP